MALLGPPPVLGRGVAPSAGPGQVWAACLCLPFSSNRYPGLSVVQCLKIVSHVLAHFYSFYDRVVIQYPLFHCGQKQRNNRIIFSSNLKVNYFCHSVTQLHLTLCDPMDCSTPGLPVLHHLLELAQMHIYRLVIPSNHLILCLPLLLPPSIFPSIRVF